MLLALGSVSTAHAEGHEVTHAPRLMFVAVHVTDLGQSLDFYTQVLGMREFQRYPGENSAEEVALTFAANISDTEPTDSGAMLLLVHEPGRTKPLKHGDALSRVALGVPDVTGLVAKVEKAGHEVLRPPSRIADGSRWVAFVRDPDGYRLELIGPAKTDP
jgi:lactoylglutathione lyase